MFYCEHCKEHKSELSWLVFNDYCLCRDCHSRLVAEQDVNPRSEIGIMGHIRYLDLPNFVERQDQSFLQQLLDSHREAARATDADGRLPLHIALACASVDRETVARLLSAHPGAIQSPNPAVRISPQSVDGDPLLCGC